jgi:aminomethyltransferase
MGEVEVTGADALKAVNVIITNDLSAVEDGQACYTAMCNEQGGIIDDLVVYRFSEARVLICVNASNREKDAAWIHAQVGALVTAEGLDATVTDRSDEYAQLALQGPRAQRLLQTLTALNLSELGRFRFAEAEVAGVMCLVSRTGYTGEDGFELYLPAEGGAQVWGALMSAEEPPTPAGLGARDTLRLEMKMALYGNDIDEETTPLEAGLGWVTKFKKERFIGKEALAAQKEAGVKRALVAFKMSGRLIPRHGYPIVNEAGEQIGVVTSGTKSPSAGFGIGMAYVPTELKKVGTQLTVQVRQRTETAEVVKPPFVTPAPTLP